MNRLGSFNENFNSDENGRTIISSAFILPFPHSQGLNTQLNPCVAQAVFFGVFNVTTLYP